MPGREILLTTFQSSVVRSFTDPDSRHSIVIAPTGSGKGVIVGELLRLRRRRRAVILVPLNALGRQTAERLRGRGVEAEFLGSEGRPSARVLVLGPERLRGKRFRDWLGEEDEYDLFVDEVHCLEDWGSGFRPSFQDLYALVREKPPTRSLWLTATLPRSHLARLAEKTGFAFRVHGSFSLPSNLSLRIRRFTAAERFDCMLTEIIGSPLPQIVFCNTRRETEDWSRVTSARGLGSSYYHAGLSVEERSGLESKLREERCPLLFATSAFGMGMDFRYLRRSVITAAPHTLLSLVQSIGRVGRASVAGTGEVLWAETDFRWNAYASTSASSTSARDESADRERARLRGFLELVDPAERESYLSEYFA